VLLLQVAGLNLDALLDESHAVANAGIVYPCAECFGNALMQHPHGDASKRRRPLEEEEGISHGSQLLQRKLMNRCGLQLLLFSHSSRIFRGASFQARL
jgi:hypothetical protein